MLLHNELTPLNTEHVRPLSPFQINKMKSKNLVTFVTVSESSFLAGLNVGYPQVVIIDESYEVRVSRANLGVHTGPRALGLNLHWLYRS